MKAQYRFIVEDAPLKIISIGDRAYLSTTDSHKAIKVLRLTLGQQLELIFPTTKQSFVGEIINIAKNNSVEVLLIAENQPQKEARLQVKTLYMSLCKSEKNDFICQKATELGLDEICFINSHRSISRIHIDKATSKIIRWNKICKAAAQQSQQTTPPSLRIVENLEQIFTNNDSEEILFCHPQGQSILARPIINKKTSLLIGAEGGFSPKEQALIDEFIPNNKISLGNNILRSETAAILTLGIINLRLNQT